METFGYFLPLIILFIASCCVGRLAISKGRNGFTWFFLSFFLNPFIIALILYFKKGEK